MSFSVNWLAFSSIISYHMISFPLYFKMRTSISYFAGVRKKGIKSSCRQRLFVHSIMYKMCYTSSLGNIASTVKVHALVYACISSMIMSFCPYIRGQFVRKIRKRTRQEK